VVGKGGGKMGEGVGIERPEMRAADGVIGTMKVTVKEEIQSRALMRAGRGGNWRRRLEEG